MPTNGATAGRVIRVLVADDEETMRAALCDLIVSESGLELAAVATNAEEAIQKARLVKPDVAVLDVRMPGGGGPHAARGIRSVSPHTRSIALSAYEDRSNVLEMLQSGAISYLVKGKPTDQILDAIRRAARGQSSLSSSIVAELVGDLSRDISERGDTGQILRMSETRFHDLLEAVPDAVAIIDASGEIILVNEQTERLFGFRRDELVGQMIEELLPRRLREAHLGVGQGYFSNLRTRPMRSGLAAAGLRKDGSEFAVDISVSTVETDTGRLATAFFRDVSSERTARELVQQKTDERFRALLESAPDAVLAVDSRGLIVLANRQTERVFGYERSEVVGQPVETLLPDRFRVRHSNLRNGYFAAPHTRPMGTGLELFGRRKDGSEFPVDISLSEIETDDGRLVAAFIRDATDREARVELDRSIAERRAVLARLVSASEEERRRIAGDIHDDSIQVMTAAGMRLQILRRSLNDPEQLGRLDQLEQTIELSITRLRHLIFELRPPALDNEGLTAALRAYLDEADETTGTSYRLDDRLTVEPSAATRVILYRIAQEVLTNIRKHAQAVSATVTLEARDEGYYMRIRDDGVGFSLDLIKDRPGHLGLPAIRERAELAGGWFRLESDPSG
ncbi:MAG: hypothetical protein QOC92_110, partial [Acidimicrobiaceae bacterium]